MRLSRNFGRHPATAAALTQVIGDIVVMTDADLQDRREDISALLGAMRSTGLDVAYTDRRMSLALNSIVGYTDLPHRLLTHLGCTVLIGSTIYVLINLAHYAAYGAHVPAGLTLIILLISVALGVMKLSLGIIGIYAFRVYQEVLHRPRFHIWKTINVAEVGGVAGSGTA